MELAKIKVSGVYAVPVCLREIPRGIKGATVRFEYADPLWDGLSKTVVFKGSGVTKDILDAGEVVKVPPEVVERAGQSLLVGVYGTDADGNQAIPTLWADLGRIRPAADPSGDETTDPSLPVWAQLQEQIDEIRETSTGGGYYTPAVTQPTEDTLQFDFTPSKAGMPAVEPVQVKLPAPDSGGNADQSGGLTTAQIEALHGMFKVCAYDDSKDVSGAYAAFKTAFGITDSGEDSGDDSGEDVHTHSYTSAVTTAATCTTAGVRTYTCSCGNSYTEAIPATGHNYVDGVCANCGAADPDAESSGEASELTIKNAGKASTFYSDEGSATYSCVTGNRWMTEKIAKVDTIVTIRVAWGTTNVNLVQDAGCVKHAGSTSAYFMERIGYANGSEYTYTYTVKAGYRLGIYNKNSSVPTSITVTTNNPDDWEYPVNDNLFDGTYVVGMLAGDGSLGTQSLKTTDYLDCSGLSELYILQQNGDNHKQYYRCYYFYDADKNAISGDTAGIAPTAPYEAISVQDGAAYIRVTQGGAYGTQDLYVGANSNPDYSIFVAWATEIA